MVRGQAGIGYETGDGETGGLLRGLGVLFPEAWKEYSPQTFRFPAYGLRWAAGCKVTWVSRQHWVKLDCSYVSGYLHGSTERYIAYTYTHITYIYRSC